MSGTWYWSSSDNNDSYAWRERPSDGTQYGTSKGNGYAIRCARR